MRISCECDEYNSLPLDIEPAILDRNPDGMCEVCGKVAWTEVCTVGALREFARPCDAVAVCKVCHHITHVIAFDRANKLAAEASTE